MFMLALLALAADIPRAAVDAAVGRLLKEHRVPGAAVAVVIDHRVAWAAGYGVREKGGAAVTDATLFQMASVSKPVTGVVAAALAEQKRVDLDRDVNDYLKGWKVPAAPAGAVTLRTLLGHRAGLTVHGFGGYPAGAAVPTLVQTLDGKPPANSPVVRYKPDAGSPVRYSGGGFCVAQLALSELTDRSFAELMKVELFDKLRLSRATFEQPLPEALRGDAATAHDTAGTPYSGKYHTYPEQAAAGLWASAGDVAAIFADLSAACAGKRSRILGRAAARDLFATGVGWPARYTGRVFWASHGGSNAGFRCLVSTHPADGRGVVVLTNSDAGDKMTEAVVSAVRRAYKW